MNEKRLEHVIDLGFYLRPSYAKQYRNELKPLKGRMGYSAGQLMKIEESKGYLAKYDYYTHKLSKNTIAEYANIHKQWSAWLDSNASVHCDKSGNFKLDSAEIHRAVESQEIAYID